MEAVERHAGEVNVRGGWRARAAVDAATFARGMAQKRGCNKKFSAGGVFARTLDVHAGSRARQIGGLFSARLLSRLLEMVLRYLS
jgi:hypothetical protein